MPPLTAPRFLSRWVTILVVVVLPFVPEIQMVNGCSLFVVRCSLLVICRRWFRPFSDRKRSYSLIRFFAFFTSGWFGRKPGLGICRSLLVSSKSEGGSRRFPSPSRWGTVTLSSKKVKGPKRLAMARVVLPYPNIVTFIVQSSLAYHQKTIDYRPSTNDQKKLSSYLQRYQRDEVGYEGYYPKPDYDLVLRPLLHLEVVVYRRHQEYPFAA